MSKCVNGCRRLVKSSSSLYSDLLHGDHKDDDGISVMMMMARLVCTSTVFTTRTMMVFFDDDDDDEDGLYLHCFHRSQNSAYG